MNVTITTVNFVNFINHILLAAVLKRMLISCLSGFLHGKHVVAFKSTLMDSQIFRRHNDSLKVN